MIGAGTIINPILKIVTVVAVLAASYFFIVRPILDTTEKVAGDANRSFQNSLQGNDDFDLNFARDRAKSFAESLRSSWPAAAREVSACVKQAGDSAGQMKRCDNFGHRLVSVVQSDRNFALSYADSLGAQGDAAGSDRVTDCVKQAGFRSAAMERCRALADKLLFG